MDRTEDLILNFSPIFRMPATLTELHKWKNFKWSSSQLTFGYFSGETELNLNEYYLTAK